MTLDEAIKRAEEVAEEKFDKAVYIMDKMKSDVALSNADECRKCAEYHRQLAEWLKDYKRLLEQEFCDDIIRRQPELDLINEGSETHVISLPTVTLHPKEGYWINLDGGYKCSKCGRIIDTNINKRDLHILYPYCNCGAKMKEIEE